MYITNESVLLIQVTDLVLSIVDLVQLCPNPKIFVDRPANKAPGQVPTEFFAISGTGLTKGASEQ